VDEFVQKKLIYNYNSRIKKFTGYENAIKVISSEEKIAPAIIAGRIAYENKDKKAAWVLANKYNRSINYTNIGILIKN
jgi:hypothetical protein